MSLAEPSLIKPAPETKRIDVPLRDVWRDGTFEGYASLFGREDLGNDIIERAPSARPSPSEARKVFVCSGSTTRRTDRRLGEDPRGCPRAVRPWTAHARCRPRTRSFGFDARRCSRRSVDRLSRRRAHAASARCGTRRLLAVEPLGDLGRHVPDAARSTHPPSGRSGPAAEDRSSEEARLVLRMAEAARQLRMKHEERKTLHAERNGESRPRSSTWRRRRHARRLRRTDARGR